MGEPAHLRGSHYAGATYRALLAAHGLTDSMSREGNGWDNAVAKQRSATIEHELLADADFPRDRRHAGRS